jgi:cytochrome c peroxidase
MARFLSGGCLLENLTRLKCIFSNERNSQMKTPSFILIALLGLISFTAQAASDETPTQAEVAKQLLAKYSVDAKEEAIQAGDANPRPIIFSAEAGRAFYIKRRTFSERDLSCSSCHTDNPAKQGKNIQTKLKIDPLAPSVNANRFTNAQKVQRNLAKHCNDLWGRDCTSQDKGDFITYLMSVK